MNIKERVAKNEKLNTLPHNDRLKLHYRSGLYV